MRRRTRKWYEAEIERLTRERDNAIVLANSTARDAQRQCADNERLEEEIRQLRA